LSVVDGFMIDMTVAFCGTATATCGEAVVSRRRGKSKAPNFTYEGPVSMICLELDVSDPGVRRRVEAQWAAVFGLRRALQRDAQRRCRAYWSAHGERAADPTALRQRLGLSRKGMEAAAKKHIEASGWMRDHLTKALGLHVADEVWKGWIGICSPTNLGAATVRRGSGRGGISPGSRGGPARTPKPHRCGRPGGGSAPWTGTWPATGTLICPRA
jgi:hypothetical protein